MICRQYNPNIRSLIVDNKLVLWKCVLSNGEEAWSDYYTEGKDPWIRLKHYCNNNNINIVEVKVIAYGIREQTVYKDEQGLDGIFIIRGISKDLSASSEKIIYNYLAFGKLNKETNLIETQKFYWPECTFDQVYEEREITPDNKEFMYFKRKTCNENCGCQNKEQT